MESLPTTQSTQQEQKAKIRTHYERPAILYEGQISTRAGTPVTPGERTSLDAVDPADLFGEP